jgi:hypothetical protein
LPALFLSGTSNSIQWDLGERDLYPRSFLNVHLLEPSFSESAVSQTSYRRTIVSNCSASSLFGGTTVLLTSPPTEATVAYSGSSDGCLTRASLFRSSAIAACTPCPGRQNSPVLIHSSTARCDGSRTLRSFRQIRTRFHVEFASCPRYKEPGRSSSKKGFRSTHFSIDGAKGFACAIRCLPRLHRQRRRAALFVVR